MITFKNKIIHIHFFKQSLHLFCAVAIRGEQLDIRQVGAWTLIAASNHQNFLFTGEGTLKK
jgi:hypothetical protein